jgi:hypothetical protein
MVGIILGLGCTGAGLDAWAQLDARNPLAGEKEAERARRGELSRHYNLIYGPMAFSLSGGLLAEYNDNVCYGALQGISDVILRPQATIGGFWPITQLNSLDLSLGLAYDYYTRHQSLNSDAPLIHPGSGLNFVFFVGDFRFQAHEACSYQENLAYYATAFRAGQQFVGLVDVRRFKRLDNAAGLKIDWDLDRVILSADYEHEDFLSLSSTYDYLTRTSEKLALTANLGSQSGKAYGLELKGSWNDFQRSIYPDHWRASAGPFLAMPVGEYVNFRLGAGYDTARIAATSPGSQDVSDYYANLQFNHRLNQFLSYQFSAGHDNQIGYNAQNAQQNYLRANVSWLARHNATLASYVSVGFVNERGARYPQDYTYYQAGVSLTWRFAQSWSALWGYDLQMRESAVRRQHYNQNRVSLGVEYRF